MQAEEYRRILAELETSNVRCCLLRDRLDPGAELADLDLLIHPEDLPRATTVLEGLGFIVRRPLSKMIHKTTMLSVVEGSSLHLDIHVQPVQDGLVYMNVEAVMSDRLSHDGYWIPCAEHQLVLLVVHNIVGKGHIQAKHLDAIRGLANTDLDFERLRASVSHYGIAGMIEEVIADPDAFAERGGRVNQLRERLRRRLFWKNRGSWLRLLRIRWMQWCYYHGLRRKGSLIVLIGPDGSGKSSLANALAARIENVFGRQVPIVYMGPWGEFQLPLTWKIRYRPWAQGERSWSHLRQDLRRDAPEVGPRAGLASKARTMAKVALRRPLTTQEQRVWSDLKAHSSPFVLLRYAKYHFESFLGLAVLYFELLWRYLEIYRYLRVGRHVIADRYIYDLQVGGMHFVTDERRRSIRILSKLFPRPDLCLYLTNAPEVLFRRKEELDVVTARRILEAYARISRDVGAEELVTDRPAVELAEGIVREHYEHMLAKMRI